VRALALAACALESWLFVRVGNAAPFLSLCLPSSNGLVSGRALGRLYGALANGGRCDGCARPVLDRAALELLAAHASDAARDAPAPGALRGRGPAGRYTCGFSPWLGGLVEAAHATTRGGAAPRRCVLGHNGLGGCVGYAELESRYAFVLLKNGYTPEAKRLLASESGTPGGLCSSAVQLDALVRAHLGVA
jgi:hypothetical protein